MATRAMAKIKLLTLYNGQYRASIGHVKHTDGSRKPKVFMPGTFVLRPANQD